MSDCPPPRIALKPDGTMQVEPHCWKCARMGCALLEGPRYPINQDAEFKAKQAPWPRKKVAMYLIETCQGNGLTIDQAIQGFSGGSVTESTRPDEMKRRRRNLYAMKEDLEREVKAQTNGEKKLITEYFAHGVRADGKSNNLSRYRVVPNRTGSA